MDRRRGKAAESQRQRLCATCSLTSYINAYDTGTTYQSIEPLGDTTTYAYSTSFAGAYPTTVTNALSQSTGIDYDFNTGLKTSTTDPNSQTTSYSYDIMERLTEIWYPDGGLTTFAYADTPNASSVQVTQKITSGSNLVATAKVDGLGRTTLEELNSDPTATDYVATTYDADGRVYTVTNPYRSTSDPTYGVTTYYKYDGLSRIMTLIPPDGSASANNVTTSYSDNCTTVTDQQGSSRTSGVAQSLVLQRLCGLSSNARAFIRWQEDAVNGQNAVGVGRRAQAAGAGSADRLFCGPRLLGVVKGPLMRWQDTKRRHYLEGFSLLEMMVVVTVILILASMSAPLYMTAIVRAREAVLRDDLFTLRSLIDRFTLDNGRAPYGLEELVTGGYLGRLPTDPFTGSNETWQETKEDAPLSPKQATPGIVDVHSGSDQVSLEGTPYNSW